MWILRWIFITILLLALASFISQNQDTVVDVKFFMWPTPEVGLAYVLLIALGAGIVLGLLVSLLKQLQLQAERRGLRKQIRKLHEELEQLRNLAIEEELLSQQIAASTSSGLNKPQEGANLP